MPKGEQSGLQTHIAVTDIALTAPTKFSRKCAASQTGFNKKSTGLLRLLT